MEKESEIKEIKSDCVGHEEGKVISMEKMKTKEIIVKEPFKSLFPIDPDTLENIRDHMRLHGFDPSQPLILWNGVIVDGHTRLEAALLEGIEEVPVCKKEFANEDEAIEYAIHNQTDRRNLKDGDILGLVEKLDRRYRIGRPKITSTEVFWKGPEAFEKLRRARMKEFLASARDACQKKSTGRTSTGRTSTRTAEVIGICISKVERARTILDRASLSPTNEKFKQGVLKGELTIHKAYTQVMKKSNSPALEFGKASESGKFFLQSGIYLTLKGHDNDWSERFLRGIDWMIMGPGQAPDIENFPDNSRLYFPIWKGASAKDGATKETTPEEWNKFLEPLKMMQRGKSPSAETEVCARGKENQQGEASPPNTPSEVIDLRGGQSVIRISKNESILGSDPEAPSMEYVDKPRISQSNFSKRVKGTLFS